MVKHNSKVNGDNNFNTEVVTFILQAGFFLFLMSPSISTRYIKPKPFTCYHSSSEHYKIIDTIDNNAAIMGNTISCSRGPIPCYGHRYVSFLALANNNVTIHVSMPWLISLLYMCSCTFD
jgi:hypothetical protein